MSSIPATPEACELTLRVAGMSCAACQTHVQKALAGVPGVQDASVDLLGHTARVTGQGALDPDALAAAVRRAGYDVVTTPPQGGTAPAGSASSDGDLAEAHDRTLGWRALLALLGGALAMLLSMPLMVGAMTPGTDRLSAWLMQQTLPLVPGFLLHTSPIALRWVLLALAVATMVFAAPEVYRAAWRAARHRATNMNTLVALGTLIAFGASAWTTTTLTLGRADRNFRDVYFEAVILILGFLLAGRWLEARARRRATASLRDFAQTETGTVRWMGEGLPSATGLQSMMAAAETLLPLDAIAVGDILRLLPGDRVPLDGVVLAGRSSVDESMLTGEPVPVMREAGDRLYSGTLNVEGVLLFRATALGADSMQAQMGRLLERARSTRAPMQRLADRVSAIFVPSVLVLALLTFAVWAVADNLGVHHLGFGRALSLAIAVLVVACPCAMGLAVPAAVAVSLGAAARRGVLIKGGEALERLAGVDTVAFDKTGTLTEGRPQILRFDRPAGAEVPDSRLLAWADAVERLSTHPLATAVSSYARERGATSETVTDARVLPGIGTEALVEGHRVALGSAALLREAGLPDPPLPADLPAATPIFVLVDARLEGTLLAGDTLRPSARPALGELAALRLRTALLTGDVLASARGIAGEAGITEIHARLLPGDKLRTLEDLQNSGRRLAMVGDGLNDAAALARADAGIAMASGTDLAREAGHILLLHHDLRLVPWAIRHARRTRRLMRQNLGWALLYNVLGIPLAAGVLLPHFGLTLSPAFASAAMAASSVSVLLNSLRLARAAR